MLALLLEKVADFIADRFNNTASGYDVATAGIL